MNKLYPIKFRPIIKDKIWGGTRLKTVLKKRCRTDMAGESWELSGFPGSVSKVSNGFLAGNSLEEIIEVYMGDLVGDAVFDKFGTLFPLLVKFIDANDILSVQVHPDDVLAKRFFNSYGKTEMWYVLEADQDAEIIVGFDREIDGADYLQHLNNGTILTVLHKEKTHSGDVFFLPPGRIHSIGAGILLAEIQQTSDATLRIYDFDRVDAKGNPRPLHLEQAMEAIDFRLYPSYKTAYEKRVNSPGLIASCPYFTVNHIEVDGSVRRNYVDLDSFVIYVCIDGSGEIICHNGEKEVVAKGITVLIPAQIAEVELIAAKGMQLLEVFIEGEGKTQQAESIIDKFF